MLFFIFYNYFYNFESFSITFYCVHIKTSVNSQTGGQRGRFFDYAYILLNYLNNLLSITNVYDYPLYNKLLFQHYYFYVKIPRPGPLKKWH